MKRKRDGKALRRARNICKKWIEGRGHPFCVPSNSDIVGIWDNIQFKRYKKAAALILAAKLRS